MWVVFVTDGPGGSAGWLSFNNAGVPRVHDSKRWVERFADERGARSCAQLMGGMGWTAEARCI